MATYKQTSLSMSEDDARKCQELKKRGITIIGIFRAGLNSLDKKGVKREGKV